MKTVSESFRSVITVEKKNWDFARASHLHHSVHLHLIYIPPKLTTKPMDFTLRRVLLTLESKHCLTIRSKKESDSCLSYNPFITVKFGLLQEC